MSDSKPANVLTGETEHLVDKTYEIEAAEASAERVRVFERFGSEYRAGEMIFHEGDAGGEMYIVQEGKVKLFKLIRGTRKVLQTVGPGEFFGEMSVLNHRPRSLSAEAATNVRLLRFQQEGFEKLIVNNLGLAIRIIKTLASRLQNADNHIVNLLYHDIESRVINALLQIADDKGLPSDDGVHVNITPREMAETMGVDVTQVKRVILTLRDKGIVKLEKTAVLIPSVERLAKTLDLLSLRHELGF
ncbi:MAG: Crp/Fnr family transcriptional regulator [Deltaproteobacteria bacterium]|nr:Crp/Fnr family transcriptional regulator [Deltaproteobacteria bacterium]